MAKGHRHNDDGNILLYGLGEAWLTDGGIFGYNNQDPRRSYVVSAKAHNVTVPEDAEERRSIRQRFGRYRDSWGITDYDRERLSSVTCESEMYKGYKYTRVLDMLSHARFRIADTLVPRKGNAEGNVYTQFRVPDDKVIRVSETNDKIIVEGKEGSMMTITYDPSMVGRVDVLTGDEPDSYSFDTAAWLKPKPVQTIRLFLELKEGAYSGSFTVALLNESD